MQDCLILQEANFKKEDIPLVMDNSELVNEDGDNQCYTSK